MSEKQLRGILLATILGSSLAFIDASIVNVILPSIQKEFARDLSYVQWVIHSYGLFLSTFLILGGVLGDRFGRKRMFQIGLVLFLVGSVASSVAPSLELLILARAFQGLGAALLTPESLSIIDATFPEKIRPKAIGIWSSFSAITGALGPPLGGILADHFGWRSVFLINLPIGLLALFVARRSIPVSCSETLSSKLDLRGTLVSTVGVGCFILGLTHKSWIISAVGLVVIAIFLMLERSSQDPLLPLDSFRSKTFSSSNAFTFFLYLPLGATFFFLPLHWINVEQYSATQAGMAVLPAILSIFALSPVSGLLAPKIGARAMLTIGSLVAAAGNLAIFVFQQQESHTYWSAYFPGLLLVGIGMAILITPLTTTAIGSLGKERSGLASGFNNAVARIAGLIGVACASLIFEPLFLMNTISCLIGTKIALQTFLKRKMIPKLNVVPHKSYTHPK